MLEKFRYIFLKKEKIQSIKLLIIILAGSFFELVGISIFMPFIQILMDTSILQSNSILHFLYYGLHFKTLNHFMAFMAGGIIAIYIIKNIFLCYMQNVLLKYSYSIQSRISSRLIATYMNEPYTFHLNKNVSEIQRCLQSDTKQFMLVILQGLQLLVEIVVCIAIGVYLFFVSKTITVVVLILVAGCAGFFFMMAKKVSRQLGARNLQYSTKMFQWINQSFGGIKEVKVLHREKFFVNTYDRYFLKFTEGARMNQLLGLVPKYLIEAVCISGLLLAIIVKMVLGKGDLIEFVPQLSVFAFAAFRLLPSIGKMNTYFNGIMYALPSVDVIYKDLKEIENHPTVAGEEVTGQSGWKFEEAIQVKGVSYCYPETEKEVIRHISLTIPKGNVVAFIGASGAGKTTMADIILGLLPPDEGDIYVDGWNIAEDMALWHRHLGYIPQVIYLSDDTIRNNIAFGLDGEEIDETRIWETLRKAQLEDFVQNLEEKLDTIVGDRGVRLSGGQRQRIGIARALYHDPDILILDEATSALDNETEKAVMESIDNLRGMKTLVIIAHRLTTIKNADIVYEFVNGKAYPKRTEDIFAK